MSILKAVNLQLKNLREQRHTENGEIFAIQAVMADMVQAIRVFGTLKRAWTQHLPYCSYLTEDEWEETAMEINRTCIDISCRTAGTTDEGMFEGFDERTRETVTYEIGLEFWERPVSTLIAPEYFARLAGVLAQLQADGFAVTDQDLETFRHYAFDSFYLDEEEYIMHDDEARYKALCTALRCLQTVLSTLLTDIKELLSHPSKEKLEAFYNFLLADYEQRFRAKEQKELWRKIRDASDTEEKMEIIQMLTDDARKRLVESGFLSIKASGLSTSKYPTEEERVQAAYDALMQPDGKPNVKAVRKYIFFHRSELKNTQVRAWFRYDLFLKLVAEEMAYGKPEHPKAEQMVPNRKDEMAQALKTLYLPRCYALLAQGHDAAWVETFVDRLLQSEHGDALCADWQVEKKRQQVVATVLGLLVEAEALQGSNAEVARMYNKGEDDRTFAKYVGNGRRSDYVDWATDYVA